MQAKIKQTKEKLKTKIQILAHMFYTQELNTDYIFQPVYALRDVNVLLQFKWKTDLFFANDSREYESK